MGQRFHNRTEAGQLLAKRLTEYAYRSDVLVLGLPRGGIPVAYQIAEALHAPLDVWLVRKLGVPGQEELAMGAIATGGITVLNQEIIEAMHIPQEALQQVAASEQIELERRDRAYRGDRPFPPIADQTVILVDDGIATSSTLRAAVAALREHHPKAIVAAAPVAPASVCSALRAVVEDVVCLMTPEPLHSIGAWYKDFSQTTDEEVCHFLQAAATNFARAS